MFLVLSFSLYKVCLEAARYSTTSHIVMLFLAGHTRETENVLSFQYTPTFLCIDDEMRYFPCCRREKQQLAQSSTLAMAGRWNRSRFFFLKLMRRTGILCVVWHPVL